MLPDRCLDSLVCLSKHACSCLVGSFVSRAGSPLDFTFLVSLFLSSFITLSVQVLPFFLLSRVDLL
jgi:hypothetical protein